MDRLKSMKNTIMSQVEAQMADLRCVDTKELGEAIDMIKDLEEAIYYCTITEAMNKKSESENASNNYYYTETMMPYYADRDYGYGGSRMYYTERGSNGSMSANMSSSGRNRSYNERQLPIDFRDDREGRSPRYRRMYMESKEMHQPKEQKIKDLESYLQELSSDITEMIEGASPEERQLMQKKIAVLATKVNNNG